MKDLDNAISLALAGAKLDLKHINALAKSSVLDLVDIGLNLSEIEKLRSLVKIELQRNIDQEATSPVAENRSSRLNRLEQLLKEELGTMMVDMPPLGSSEELSFTGGVGELGGDETFVVGHETEQAEDKKIMGHGGTARMARQQLYTIAQAAQGLYDSLSDDDEVPEWSQSHIAQAEQMLDSVAEYLQYKILRSEMHDG
tara:strand:+ start:376 stop:972 length:597 start_codon:yes stop_codon:yes gene_type:complete